MSALLALLLAAAPGCPAARSVAAEASDEDLAGRAGAIVRTLAEVQAGPVAALEAAADALEGAPDAAARRAAAAAFRGALVRHCALAAAPPLPEASGADRAALALVLARPELSQGPLDAWALRRALLRLWDWIVERLGTEEAEQYASLGRAVFLGAAAAAVALGVAARLRRRERRAGRGGGRPSTAAAEAAPPDAGAGAAEEALRRGDRRAAVRLALLAALGALERAGRVPRGRALTNEELVRVTRATSTPLSPPAATDLEQLARTFDRAVYGGLPVPLEDARAALEHARRIVAAAGGVA